jgi:hypothetical protein
MALADQLHASHDLAAVGAELLSLLRLVILRIDALDTLQKLLVRAL